MRKSSHVIPFILVGLLASGIMHAQAEEQGSAPEVAEPVPPILPAPVLKSKSPLIQKRGKRRDQKDTEGTEAPGRFEADTILKSPYSVDGQPLEVDPD